jgi:hypothetical protein
MPGPPWAPVLMMVVVEALVVVVTLRFARGLRSRLVAVVRATPLVLGTSIIYLVLWRSPSAYLQALRLCSLGLVMLGPRWSASRPLPVSLGGACIATVAFALAWRSGQPWAWVALAGALVLGGAAMVAVDLASLRRGRPSA